jgi:ATP-dependent helicase/nuclease subunit B
MDVFDPANDWETELARFKALARAEFESGVAWPEKAAHWCSQFESFASGLLETEQQRRLKGSIADTEVEGRFRFESLGIDLVCKADRIDRLDDGSYAIYDYKSSKPPSLKSMGELEKQLLLEAVIAENGGFSKLGPVNVSRVAYLSIWGDHSATTKVFSDGEVAGVKAEASAMFAAYLDDEYGFLSRRIPNDRYAGNYDHLARFGEWSDSDVAQKVDVR